MADDAHTEDLSEETQPAEDAQPERLRVHSLARVLGTTSKRVLDALTELDGRPRSAQSAVEDDEVERVREALADQPDGPAPDAENAPATPDADGQTSSTDPGADSDEPESRLMLETGAAQDTPERAAYLPLFVAPQPIRVEYDADETTMMTTTTATIPARTPTMTSPTGRRAGAGAVDAVDVAGAVVSRTVTIPTPTVTPKANAVARIPATIQTTRTIPMTPTTTTATTTVLGEGGTRRRRRRRRRKSGSGDNGENASPDDPPNTVVHEREPRKSGKGGDKDNNEIQGISGSTRLEAKRQRRRDGRDAGRRRPPILSEAEFLARREAVERMMVVRDKVRTEPPHEGARYTQIAVLEDGVVVEHFVTSAASASLVGNIYLGIVQNVLPSMEAAFVDIGRGRNGVLYAGEVNWEAAGLGGAQRKIEQALKPGDYVVVQVSKDPVGHKGARLTTQVSLAGRYLVYVPGASSTGISRKLPDTERQRLKEILREVVPPEAGVIIRTASEGVKEEDIRTDVNRLQERWTQIESKAVETKKKAAGAADRPLRRARRAGEGHPRSVQRGLHRSHRVR